MMQCRDIEELMMEYLYQELDAAQAEAFKAHVGGCARCGAELASLERTRLAVRSLPELDPPAAVTARLLHEAAKRARPAPEEARGGIVGWIASLFRPVALHPAFSAVAALVLIGGVAGFLAMKGKVSDRPPMIGTPEAALAERRAEDRGLHFATGAPAPAATPTDSFAKEEEETGADEPARRGRIADQQRAQGVLADTTDGRAALDKKPAAAAPSSPPPPQADPGPAAGARGGAGGVVMGEGDGVGDGEQAEDEDQGGGYYDQAPAQKRDTTAAPGADTAAAKPEEERPDDDNASTRGATTTATPPREPSPAKPAPQRSAPPSGDSAGDVEEAPAAADAGRDRAEQEKKKREDAKRSSNSGSLHGQARAAADRGNCKKANDIKKKIQRSDPEYYEKRVRRDPELKRCEEPSRTKSPAPADAPSTEQAPSSTPK